MNDLIDSVKIKGEIIFDGKDINSPIDVINLRTWVGMVFQKPNPFPMSIYENIAYGPKCQGMKDKNQLDNLVKESLMKAALWDEVKDRLNKSALGLSGGQQQRLCIARTIAMNPEVILMDEPTSALDPIATAKIEDLMSSLKKTIPLLSSPIRCSRCESVIELVFFLMGEVIEFNETPIIFNKSP